MDKKQKITNDIKVPNKDMDVLKKHFSHCFTKNGKFDIEKFKQELSENEIDFYKESYGMDWLGKSYARLLASDSATTLLKEDETHNSQLNTKNSENLLIKGDNLEVLKHLSNAYYEKIKMIYIDPPYNTGSDGFVYQDDRKFSVSEFRQLAGVDEDKAKRILSFVDSKSNSHSAWLTFMYPRLYIAKQLLRDDGVIFISIDDNEVAQLRLLMDEIFGEENFIANVIWEKKYSPQNDAKWFSDNHDHILIYAKIKEIWRPNLLHRSEEQNKRYKNPDNDHRGVWKSSDLSVKTYSPEYDYPITTPSGRIVNLPEGRCWMTNRKKMQELIEDNRIWFGKNGDNVPSLKRFLTDVKNGITPLTIWFRKDVGDNQEGKQELLKLMPENLFQTPKVVRLMKRMLHLGSNSIENDLILDFFAGSGTTGDAVMQLNAEDGGNRKYILVQLPEKIDQKKSKTAYDFVKELNTKNSQLKTTEEPTIFEITKERLIRASKKINTELDEKTKNLQLKIKKLKQELPTEETKTEITKLEKQITKNQKLKIQNYFKIFETMPIWEDYNFEADELDEQLTLFDENKLTEEDLRALLVTWKTYDGIPLVNNFELIVLSGETKSSTLKTKNSELTTKNYTAYYVNEKLYLMDKSFKTEHLKTLLEKIDSDKKFNPTSIIAFGYHFESKNLREIAENIKSYANKKNIDIDFITRY